MKVSSAVRIPSTIHALLHLILPRSSLATPAHALALKRGMVVGLRQGVGGAVDCACVAAIVGRRGRGTITVGLSYARH